MHGTSCGDRVIETFPTPHALPQEARVLLESAAGPFDTVAWWNVVMAHAMPPGAQALFVTVRSNQKIVALVPMLRTGGRLSSFTTPYTCVYTPLFAAGLDQPAQIAAMADLARFGRPAGIIRLDALPAEWDGLAALEAGARRAGLVPLRFEHFGNWYEDVGDLDWSAYLLQRPGALRETIRRRRRQTEKLPQARFDLFTGPGQMEQATAAFEAVYRRSWKNAEPHPTFNVALMRAMADLGVLRLGVWSVGMQPVAVQFWVIQGGHAIILKLAHDEAYKAHSPGTVLTALMLRHLLDREHVARIDFGRGDDAYKQGWAKQRRQRIGLLLADPWSTNGAAALLRHFIGRLRRTRH